MSKNISFLIGAGFSSLDGYPMAPQMNKRLGQIQHDEILVHTSNSAKFLNGKDDPNSHWMGVVERRFVQEFLEFYNNTVLEGDFDYENFYDYFKRQYRQRDYEDPFLEFCEAFKNKYQVELDEGNLLHRFDIVYNQLVAQLITKFYEPVHLGKPYNPKFRPFFELIELIEDNSIIHFHSLNHDLFLEYLSSSSTIQGNLASGFQELGSQYYGTYRERHKVRLPYFNDKYDTKYRLYKLHGSIDNYSYNFDGDWVYLKTKYGVSTNRVLKEINHDGELRYIRAIDNYYPEFLSGKSDKILQYNSDDYYQCMFSHFEENLKESELLIVIGYSFMDVGINEYINDHYLSDENKKIVVIDINDPENEFTQRKNSYLDLDGVSNFSVESIKDFLFS